MTITLIVGGAFIALGMLTLAWCSKKRSLAFQAANWPSAIGKIEESKVEYARAGADRYDFLKLRYSYEKNGKQYSASALDLFETEKRLTVGEMEDVVRRYPEGSAAKVYCNELDPSFAVLEPDSLTGFGRSRNLGYLLLAVGLAMFCFAISGS